jgi:tryptophan synthase alpha chain
MSLGVRASGLAATFARCRAAGRAAFIPYVTAGDPDLATTGELVRALAAAGADIVELGVPFSDPIADGPVNQRAAMRALASRTTLDGILALVAGLRADGVAVPVVLFTYFNPLHVRGVERFAASAAAAGVDGVLCVDLPPEEAGELGPALRAQGLDLVFLLAPTSTPARVARVAELASGFVYYVSRTGVTGERDALPADLARDVRRLRRRLGLPVAVGFGISTPEQVAAVGRLADGVVVGSALVRTVEAAGSGPGVAAAVAAQVRILTAGLTTGVAAALVEDPASISR